MGSWMRREVYKSSKMDIHKEDMFVEVSYLLLYNY